MFQKKAVCATLLAVSLATPAYAMVDTGKDVQLNYELKYPLVYTTNPAAQQAINSDIYRYITAFRSAYKAGDFASGGLDYKTMYEDDNFVSIVLTDYRYSGGNHGLTNYIGLNYWKKDGRRLTLPFFAKIVPADSTRIYNQPVYNVRGDEIPVSELDQRYKSTPISGNYFMLGNGKLALIYQPYELASYSQGMTYIVLDPQLIDYFNRKNS